MKWIKRIVIAVVVLAGCLILIGLYVKEKNTELSFEKPITVTITRGNLRIPVNATGTVKTAEPTEIKSKASGTVVLVNFEAGDMVKKGDLLVKLDPDDEQRAVDNAKAEVARAQANLNLATSRSNKTARDWPAQIEKALSNLESARAELQQGCLNFKRLDLSRRRKPAEGARYQTATPENQPSTGLEPKDDPLVQRCEKRLDAAAQEAAEAERLYKYGREVVETLDRDQVWERLSPVEYQRAMIQVWQAHARLQAVCVQVRDAVNARLIVDQTRIEVDLAKEVVGQANVTLESALQRHKETVMRAPIDGQIQQVFVQEGQIIASGITAISGGTPLMTLADVSKLYVEADVDEADIGRVRDLAPPGRTAALPVTQPTTQPSAAVAEDIERLEGATNVSITVDAFREEDFYGVVDRVFPHAKLANNVVTYTVRILLTSPNSRKLMLGLPASVDFTTRERKNVLLVDIDAIKFKDDHRGVYVPAEPEPKFVPVKLGPEGEEQVEIRTDELKEGQKVYTRLPKKRKSKDDEEDKDED